jgi:hypothetical protein
MHFDLHVDDLRGDGGGGAARRRELQAPRRPADNPDGTEMFTVWASPRPPFSSAPTRADP